MDINGNWQTPHATHNTGKVIDIGFRDRNDNQMDLGHKLLLRQVIRANSNYQSIERCEGGINIHIPSHDCERHHFPAIATHIHASFTN